MKWIQNYFMAISCPMNILGFSYNANFMVSVHRFFIRLQRRVLVYIEVQLQISKAFGTVL